MVPACHAQNKLHNTFGPPSAEDAYRRGGVSTVLLSSLCGKCGACFDELALISAASITGGGCTEDPGLLCGAGQHLY